MHRYPASQSQDRPDEPGLQHETIRLFNKEQTGILYRLTSGKPGNNRSATEDENEKYIKIYGMNISSLYTVRIKITFNSNYLLDSYF